MPLVISYKPNIDESEYACGCLIASHEEDSEQSIIYFSPAQETEMINYVALNDYTHEIKIIDIENKFGTNWVNVALNTDNIWNVVHGSSLLIPSNEDEEDRLCRLIDVEKLKQQEAKKSAEIERLAKKAIEDAAKIEQDKESKRSKDLQLLATLKAQYEPK